MSLLLVGIVCRRWRLQEKSVARHCGPLADPQDVAHLVKSIGTATQAPLSASDMLRAKSAMRVLLVDDNDMVRESIARRLRIIGYDVVEASNGHDANLILPDRIDILITDIVLHQDIDGWALAEIARRMDPNLPLVFMSGYMSARQPDVMAADELASFIRKPLHSAELQAVIAGLLALRETRRLRVEQV